jgi:hypothetical protein
MTGDVSLYALNPAAINKLPDEQRVEIFRSVLARVEYFHQRVLVRDQVIEMLRRNFEGFINSDWGKLEPELKGYRGPDGLRILFAKIDKILAEAE